MATADGTRHYLIINASTLFDADSIPIVSAAPVGSVIHRHIGGRPIRIWLTGDPLDGGWLHRTASGLVPVGRTVMRPRSARLAGPPRHISLAVLVDAPGRLEAAPVRHPAPHEGVLTSVHADSTGLDVLGFVRGIGDDRLPGGRGIERTGRAVERGHIIDQVPPAREDLTWRAYRLRCALLSRFQGQLGAENYLLAGHTAIGWWCWIGAALGACDVLQRVSVPDLIGGEAECPDRRADGHRDQAPVVSHGSTSGEDDRCEGSSTNGRERLGESHSRSFRRPAGSSGRRQRSEPVTARWRNRRPAVWRSPAQTPLPSTSNEMWAERAREVPHTIRVRHLSCDPPTASRESCPAAGTAPCARARCAGSSHCPREWCRTCQAPRHISLPLLVDARVGSKRLRCATPSPGCDHRYRRTVTVVLPSRSTSTW